MQYSTLAALQVANKAYRPETTELHGRVRVAVIDTVLEKPTKKFCSPNFRRAVSVSCLCPPWVPLPEGPPH